MKTPHGVAMKRLYLDDELKEVLRWVEADLQGRYRHNSTWAGNPRQPITVLWFSDPDAAFAFKMRYG